jgi:GWxTD domain-containing protein
MRARARGAGCLLLALGALGAAAPARAGSFDLLDESPEPARARPRFTADAGSRRTPSGPEVILGFEVPYSELYFRPVGSRFECRFDLIFVLLRDGRQVGGDSFTETRVVSRREEARTPGARVERHLALAVAPGKYRAQVTLREAAAGRENRLEWDLVVPDYVREPLSLSTLWVTGDVPEVVDSVAATPPPGWIRQRDYGERALPRGVTGEVYRADGGTDSSRIQWRILGGREETLQQGETALPPGPGARFALRPDFGALWLGEFTFEVRARAAGHEARRRFRFRALGTTGALETDAEQSLELIGLIAGSDELQELRRAPATERREAWERFWKRRDPTPGTPENEFRDEFFRRVRYANEHYSVLGPGWRSDRGRIFIQYGPPDQVESYPFNIDGPAHEIWIYQRLGKRFVFVDADGFGRYELASPGRF